MMTKADAIEAITKLNPTATPGFLAGFATDELSRYLSRLEGLAACSNGDDPADAETPPVSSDQAVMVAAGVARHAAAVLV